MKVVKRFTVVTLVMALLAFNAALAGAGAEMPDKVPRGYPSFSGTVTEVADAAYRDGLYIVCVENDGDPAVFIVTADTCDITGKKPAVGDKFTGFYDASLPMPMIYPPQYQAEAFCVNLDAKYTVKVARFDDKWLSEDGELVIHIGEDTVILQANGDVFDGGAGALAGRKLAVVYTVVTQSIPPQTAPEKIFVLYERAVPLPGAIDEDTMSILVNGVKIEAPKPYFKGPVLMVPLRAIAEALGYEVRWEAATKSVYLNQVISLSVGKDYYTFARMAPIQLGTAPELVNGKTFVPLSFFKQVARMNNAYYFEGVIEINNDEPME